MTNYVTLHSLSSENFIAGRQRKDLHFSAQIPLFLFSFHLLLLFCLISLLRLHGFGFFDVSRKMVDGIAGIFLFVYQWCFCCLNNFTFCCLVWPYHVVLHFGQAMVAGHASRDFFLDFDASSETKVWL